ncbi:MAG: FHA domain-containing protein [Thermogutta sp.]
MLIRLKVIRGKANRDVVDLSIPAVIGRSREADLTVIHPMISRRHCELFKRDGRIMVRDLGSLNGTYLGSSPVKESELHAGDTLAIGPLTFEVEFVRGFKGGGREDRSDPAHDPQSDLVVADSNADGFSAPTPPPDRAAAPGDKLGTEPQPFASLESSAATVPAEFESSAANPVADTDKVEPSPQGLFGDLPPPESFAPPTFGPATAEEPTVDPHIAGPPIAESAPPGQPDEVADASASEGKKRQENAPPRGDVWANSPAPFTPVVRTAPVEVLPESSGGEGDAVSPPRRRGSDEFALHLPDRVIPAEELPAHASSENPPILDGSSSRSQPTARGPGGWWPFGKR